MTAKAEQIRFAKQLLMDRVSVKRAGDSACRVVFDAPDRDEMVALGVAEDVADRMTGAPWWEEMLEAVVETPDFCEDDASPSEVLGIARDTVDEYISKRY